MANSDFRLRDNFYSDRCNLLTGLSGLLVLTSISIAWEFSRAFFVLLALFSIGYLLKIRPRLNSDQKLYWLSISLFFAAAFISYLFNERPHRGLQVLLETYLLLVFSMPLLWLYTRHAPTLSFIWTILGVAAMVVGIRSIGDLSILGWTRAGGSSDQPVQFAGIAFSLAGAVFCGTGYFLNRKPVGILFWSGAVGLSLLAVLLTQSRGVWLAIPFVGVFTITFFLHHYRLRQKILFAVLVMILIPVISYQIPIVQERLDLAAREISSALSSDSTEKKATSIQYRLDLWRSSFDIFLDNVALGVGPGNFKPEMQNYVNEHDGFQRLPDLKHAHNEVLNTLMTKGIVGALALLLMLSIHFFLFAKYLNRAYSAEIRALAAAGCTMIITVAVLGLTAAPLERKITLIFYGFVLVLLLGKVNQLSAQKSVTPAI